MTFTVRRLKSGLLAKSDIESYFSALATAQETVDRCSCVVGMQGKLARLDIYLLNSLSINIEQINQHMGLKKTSRVYRWPNRTDKYGFSKHQR